MTKPSKPDESGKKLADAALETTSSTGSPPFPIVGIGASAGGLEALELFLGQVPDNCGCAFVIVQHLDPTHRGMMPELLQRATAMKVVQVRDRMKVRPNCTYVIPPNKDMSILHGVLHLFEPTAVRGQRLPIDFFFRCLAEDRQEQSIGVILSGMGSDGTLGLRAIKEKGGLVLVQEPGSARFDSMPRSAINADLADVVAVVEDLPGKISDLLRHAIILGKREAPIDDKGQNALEKIFILLRSRSGHDFSLYKESTIYRRVERRMGIHQIDKIATYVRYLRENHQEVELLFKELLIGVTNFFRDPSAWDYLQREVLPALLASHPDGGMLRAWTAGCSTGEEAYSLAIAFKETLNQVKAPRAYKLQIFATDLDQDAINKARKGVYPTNIAADVSAERLQRYFVLEEDQYRVSNEIRQMVTFATQNVIMDPPFTKLDILTCRNLLIYLTPKLQKRLMPLFHYTLNPGGVLFLGNSETIGNFINQFEPINGKSRLYRRLENALPGHPVVFPVTKIATLQNLPKELKMAPPQDTLQSIADQLLLQKFSPPAVMVTGQGDILYISGRTGKYLEPASGKANWNLFAMAREGLRQNLAGAFQKATKTREPVVVKGNKIGTNGGTQLVDATIQAIEEPAQLRGMFMVVFTDVSTPPEKRPVSRTRKTPAGSSAVIELEEQLNQAREELQTMREEMQSSQEELTSANEELQSTNEELQSTNEELTTSREEMQSLNEELQTVNAEQLSKMDELTRIHDDMRNLLNSTDIITVFLDKQLHIKRFTTDADRIFKVLPGDVGRPLSDITNDLQYSDFIENARGVLQSLAFSEKQIKTKDGRWFTVRIMPYRTQNDIIDGLVITFIDISVTKNLETELREEVAQLKTQLDAKK
jgi:two-component system, chemotaxis family, CheB/CheR fusion protein